MSKRNKMFGMSMFVVWVILCGLSCGFALTLKEEKGSISIENSYYEAILSTEGGSIKSLRLKPTGEDLTEATGIGNDIEIICGHPGNTKEIYRYKVIKNDKDEVVIQMSGEAVPGNTNAKGITYEKSYVFTEKTPLIKVNISIINNGPSKNFGYRVHNMVKVGKEMEGDVYFCPVLDVVENVTKTKEIAFRPGQKEANNYIGNFSGGWIGAMDKGKDKAIIFKVNPEVADKLFVWFGGNSSTIEWWYKPVCLEKGSVFQASYIVLPLSGIDSISQALVKGAALCKNIELENIVRGVSSIEENGKIKEFSKILIVGSQQDLLDWQLYNVEKSIRKLPFIIDFAECRKREHPRYESDYLTNFPVSLREVMKYGSVIFIDIPGWVLSEDIQKLLVSYVDKGGSLIFIGDHARGYKDSVLSSMMPLSFDYSKEVKGWCGRLMRDKSSWLKGGITDKSSFIARGIPQELPEIVIHQSKIKEGAEIILSSGNFPLLASQTIGKGKVISFPISLTDFISAGHARPEADIKYDSLNDKLVNWNYYGKLWRNIILYCMDRTPPVDFSAVPALEGIITSPSSVRFDCEIANYSKIRQKGLVCFSIYEADKILREQNAKFDLAPTCKNKAFFKMDLCSRRGEYKYSIEIRDNQGNMINWIEGSFYSMPKIHLDVTLPVLRVYGKNSSVPLRIKGVNLERAKTYYTKVSLVDFRGMVVSEIAPVKIAAEEIEQNLSIGNLMKGNYKVRVELLEMKERVGVFEEEVWLIPNIDRENYFPIIAWEPSIADKEKTLENIKKANEIGFNTVQFMRTKSYRENEQSNLGNRAELYGMDEAQKLGMAFSPTARMRTSWNRWYGGCPNLIVTKEIEDAAAKDVKAYLNTYGRSPRRLGTYIADEPNIVAHKSEKCVNCKEAFKKEYGYEMSLDRKDKNYYTAHKYLCDKLKESLKDGMNFVKKYCPDFGPYAIVSRSGAAFNLDITGIASAIDVGIDNYTYGHDPYYLDFIWSASGFNNKPGLCGTTAILGLSAYYPRYMGTQIYNTIAHNGKSIIYFVWDELAWSLCDNEEKVKYSKRAFREVREFVPLFNHLSKQRAKAAMLHSLTTYAILPCEKYDDCAFVSLHRICRQVFGHVDVLHEEQIKKGEYLPDYSILILPENTLYLPESVMKEISAWVESGGILVVLPKSGLLNEYQEESGALSRIYGASWGKEIQSSVNGAGLLPVNGRTLIPQGAKPLCQYQNGDPAVTSNKYGKGKVVLVGFSLKDKKILESITEGIDSWFIKSSDPDIDATLFPDENNFYVVAVNQVHKNGKTKIMLKVPKKNYFICDLVSGEEINYSYEDETLVIPLDVEPLWGRAMAILSERPAKLTTTLTQAGDGKRGKLTYLVRLLRENGKTANCKLPVMIEVIDSEGRSRDEYGGIMVLKGGEFIGEFILADNEPDGRWSIEVTDKISKTKTVQKFKVNNKTGKNVAGKTVAAIAAGETKY